MARGRCVEGGGEWARVPSCQRAGCGGAGEAEAQGTRRGSPGTQGWGFGTKRGRNVAWAGNRTRASRVAGENSTTEPPMHPWRAPPCNLVTVATAFRELPLGGTVKEAGGMDGGPWASRSRRGRARVCTPRVEVAAESPGPGTFCASPGSPDRHARCRPRKAGAGPNFALTGISIRAGDPWLGGCLLVHPHPPVAKFLAARASRRSAAGDRCRRPSQPARTWWAAPRKPPPAGGWWRRPGGNANRLEGVRLATHQGNRPSVGPSCLTRLPGGIPRGVTSRGLARCVVERWAGVVGERPSSEGAWRPQSGRMGTGSSAGLERRRRRVGEIVWEGGVGQGAVTGRERLLWALAGARPGSLVVWGGQKVGLSGVGFEPTPPGETAT